MAAICGLMKRTYACIGDVGRVRVYFGGDSKRRRGAIGRRRMLGNPADYAEFIPLPLFLSLSPPHTVLYSILRQRESRDPRHRSALALERIYPISIEEETLETDRDKS